MTYRNNKCYANPLGGCSKKISREHYFSRSILEAMSTNGGVHLHGISWLKGKSKKLSPSSIVSKVLCDSHNNELSKFDQHICKLYQILQNAFKKAPTTTVFSVSCSILEKWIIKVYLGLLAANHFSIRNGIPYQSKGNIPHYLLEYLFHNTSLPNKQGLCITPFLEPIPGKNKIITVFDGISIIPYTENSTNNIHSLGCVMHGIPLYLQLTEPRINLAQHRPTTIKIENITLELQW